MWKKVRFCSFLIGGTLSPFVPIHIDFAWSYAAVIGQVTDASTEAIPASTEFWNGVILAVFSATLGFLASIGIETLNKRKLPKKQISYTKIIKTGIVGDIEKDVEDKITISYDGRPAKNMFYSLFDIENTGNQQVKNQEIRFESSDKGEILDVFLEPQKLPREMDFEEIIDPELGANEKKYKIGILKPGEKLGFRFIVKTPENAGARLKHYTKNEEDVIFVAREVKQVTDDIDKIKSFLTLLMIFTVLPFLLKEFFVRNELMHYFFREFIIMIILLITLGGFVFIILPRLSGFIEAIVSLLTSSFQSATGVQSDKIGLLAQQGAKIHIERLMINDEDRTL